MSPSLKSHWALDPQVAYLNHGSYGACPRPVLEAQGEYRRRLEREPALFLSRELEALADEAGAQLAAFLGADPADVVRVSNATTGVNAVLRSFPLAPADEVLVTSHGYNACRNAVDFVTARARARTRVVELPFPLDGPRQIVESVLAGVTPRTRLALIDHVTSKTALVLPLAELIGALRERGVQVLIDGAHAPGMLELNLGALEPDYYVGNCHKWLCSPKGAGFLYVRRERQPQVRPTVISHGANSMRRDRSRFQLEFGWCGTDDPTPWLCVPHALRFLASLLPGGWDELRQRNHDLALEARTLMLAALDVQAPAPDAMIGSIASVPLPARGGATPPGDERDPLQSAAFQEHGIETFVFPWPEQPERLLRISAQLYNTRAEFERLAQALPALLQRERQAVP